MDGYLCRDGLDTGPGAIAVSNDPFTRPAYIGEPPKPPAERQWMVFQAHGYAIMVEWEG